MEDNDALIALCFWLYILVGSNMTPHTQKEQCGEGVGEIEQRGDSCKIMGDVF